jgi:hypothetical protein
MPLTSNIRVAAAAQLSSSTYDLGTAVAPVSLNRTLQLASGVAAGQADKIFADQRTIAASGNDDLDLAGVLTDPLGAPLTFVKVKALIVAAASGNTNNVVVGGAGTNGWVGPFGAATHTVTVRPGGALVLMTGAGDANGYAVTAGTGDLLRIANSAGVTPVTYDIVIVGTSA